MSDKTQIKWILFGITVWILPIIAAHALTPGVLTEVSTIALWCSVCITSLSAFIERSPEEVFTSHLNPTVATE